MRRGLIGVAFVVGCHSPTPENSPDATASCADVIGTVNVVNHTVWGPATGVSASIPIPATAAGDLLVVEMTWHGVPIGPPPFAKLTDHGSELEPWVIGGVSSCGTSTVFWIENRVASGVTALDADLTSAGVSYSSFSVAVVELSGAVGRLTDPFELGCDSAAGTMTASSLYACPGQLVLSTMTACGELSTLAPPSPFVALGAIDGSELAYDLPTVPGFYGAVWSGGGACSATTLVFSP